MRKPWIAFYLSGLLLAGMGGCQNPFSSSEAPEAVSSPVVARVGDAVLTHAELKAMVPPLSDSADYQAWQAQAIKAWVTREILYQEARQHLPPHMQDSLEKILHLIKADIWGEEYLRLRAYQQLDTTISAEEIAAYYQQNRTLFPSPDTLMGVRYVSFPAGRLPRRLQRKIARWLQNIPDGGNDSLLKSCAMYQGECRLTVQWLPHLQLNRTFPELGPSLWGRLMRRQKTVSRFSTAARTYWFWVAGVQYPGQPLPLPLAAPAIRRILQQHKFSETIEKARREIVERAQAGQRLRIEINMAE